jgi:ABC-2 type transport system permease protein
MNYAMIKPLIQKDWYLQRYVVLGYSLAGFLALFLVNLRGETWITIGNLLLITVLIALGFHLAVGNIITERTQQTLPFVMSLPISIREYTTAKILANLGIYLIPWSVLAITSYAIILTRDTLPDGLIPMVTLILVGILVNYCLMLTAALTSESQGWTIAVVILGNLLLQTFMSFISNLPGTKNAIASSSVVWDTTTVLILLAEFGIIAVLLCIIFLVQFKKTDFI